MNTARVVVCDAGFVYCFGFSGISVEEMNDKWHVMVYNTADAAMSNGVLEYRIKSVDSAYAYFRQ